MKNLSITDKMPARSEDPHVMRDPWRLWPGFNRFFVPSALKKFPELIPLLSIASLVPMLAIFVGRHNFMENPSVRYALIHILSTIYLIIITTQNKSGTFTMTHYLHGKVLQSIGTFNQALLMKCLSTMAKEGRMKRPNDNASQKFL